MHDSKKPCLWIKHLLPFLIFLRIHIQHRCARRLSHQLQWESFSSPPPSNPSCPLTSLEWCEREVSFKTCTEITHALVYVKQDCIVLYTVTSESDSSGDLALDLNRSVSSHNTSTDQQYLNSLKTHFSDSRSLDLSISSSRYTCITDFFLFFMHPKYKQNICNDFNLLYFSFLVFLTFYLLHWLFFKRAR